MMKKSYSIVVVCFVTFLYAFTTLLPEKKSEVQLLTKKDKFTAGTPIKLEFLANDNAVLYINHSYGKTLLSGKKEDNKLLVEIPKIYTQKTGFVSWYLIESQKTILQGSFEIVPNDNTKTLVESYLGPPSTLVADNHFVMFVTIPTDRFDNPKLPNTNVIIKNQFLNYIEKQTIPSKDFIAWKNIYAPTKSGIVLISAECNATTTKEFDAVIYPSTATDFTINFNRNHDFADGHQMTTLKTSVIKDKYGNTVSDGTFVLFSITTKNNNKLTTTGTTIDGVATAKMLHPETEENYLVKAYVTGMASSNLVSINYKKVNPTIQYHFKNNNRTLAIEPIKSFMNQLIPDGVKVEVKVFQNNKLLNTLQENSLKGKAIFNFPEEFYTKGNYRFEISILGSTLKTATVKL